MSHRVYACIQRHNADPWTYLRHYLTAADTLLEACDQHLAIDTVAYPIAFLYRHAIELALKGLIISGNLACDNKYHYPVKHDLCELWNVAAPFLKEYAENPSSEADAEQRIENAQQSVAKCNMIDPESFAFRYPTTKSGERNLQDTTRLDFMTISSETHEVVEIVAHIADCFDGLHSERVTAER